MLDSIAASVDGDADLLGLALTGWMTTGMMILVMLNYEIFPIVRAVLPNASWTFVAVSLLIALLVTAPVSVVVYAAGSAIGVERL